MLIEILSRTSVAGTAVRPGDVVDCLEQDARYLVSLRKARMAGSQSLTKQPDSGFLPDDEPTAEERKPTVRRRKPKATTSEV
jgi:hypothetical protein